jgi:hypothetical protein
MMNLPKLPQVWLFKAVFEAVLLIIWLVLSMIRAKELHLSLCPPVVKDSVCNERGVAAATACVFGRLF